LSWGCTASSRCVQSKIDPNFGRDAFRVINLLAMRRVLRAFSSDSFFVSALSFLACDVQKDMYAVFTTLALLAEKCWEQLFRRDAHVHARRFLLEGKFDNRIGASLMLMEMIVHGHPQVKDMIANSDIFDGICALLECFSALQFGLFCETIVMLLGVNFPLYRARSAGLIGEGDLTRVAQSFSCEGRVSSLAELLVARVKESA